MTDDSLRGTGQTTKQLLDAPLGSVFVWCNDLLEYPKRLAKKCGRSDLIIVNPWWLHDRRWAGMELTGVTTDHSLAISPQMKAEIAQALTRVRR